MRRHDQSTMDKRRKTDKSNIVLFPAKEGNAGSEGELEENKSHDSVTSHKAPDGMDASTLNQKSSKGCDQDSVDQLSLVRMGKKLMSENRRLIVMRQVRLGMLRRICTNDPVQMKGIMKIIELDQRIMGEQADSMCAEALKFQKYMTAYETELPLDYIKADTTSHSIESINRTMMLLVQRIAELPSDSEIARAHKAKLEVFRTMKADLYDELSEAQKGLSSQMGFAYKLGQFIAWIFIHCKKLYK